MSHNPGLNLDHHSQFILKLKNKQTKEKIYLSKIFQTE